MCKIAELSKNLRKLTFECKIRKNSTIFSRFCIFFLYFFFTKTNPIFNKINKTNTTRHTRHTRPETYLKWKWRALSTRPAKKDHDFVNFPKITKTNPIFNKINKTNTTRHTRHTRPETYFCRVLSGRPKSARIGLCRGGIRCYYFWIIW